LDWKNKIDLPFSGQWNRPFSACFFRYGAGEDVSKQFNQGGIKMECYFHPEKQAVAQCMNCEKPICQDCVDNFKIPNGNACRDCFSVEVEKELNTYKELGKVEKWKLTLVIIFSAIGLILAAMVVVSSTYWDGDLWEVLATFTVSAWLGLGIGGNLRATLSRLPELFSAIAEAFSRGSKLYRMHRNSGQSTESALNWTLLGAIFFLLPKLFWIIFKLLFWLTLKSLAGPIIPIIRMREYIINMRTAKTTVAADTDILKTLAGGHDNQSGVFNGQQEESQLKNDGKKTDPTVGIVLGVALSIVLGLCVITVSFLIRPGNERLASNNASEVGAEVEQESGDFVDARDGQKYGAVTIGNAAWMAQNLNYQPQTGKSWCYNGNTSNCAKYGRLYDWNAAMAACPTGWHLPSRREWANLAAASGGDAAGTALKTETGWEGNGNGSNDYGFSALPSGSRAIDGSFKNVGNRSLWWTATEFDSDSAYYRRMGHNYGHVYEGTFGKGHGFSVRCVQNNN
jgi:uncharacterized protein (TIGR02145 family)